MKNLRTAVLGLFAAIGALASVVTIIQWVTSPAEQLSVTQEEVPFSLPSAIAGDISRFNEDVFDRWWKSRSRFLSERDAEKLAAQRGKLTSEVCSLREWKGYKEGQENTFGLVRIDMRDAWKDLSPLNPFVNLQSFVRIKLVNTGSKKLESVRIVTNDFSGFISIRQDRSYSFRRVDTSQRIPLAVMEPGDVAFVNGWTRWTNRGPDIYSDRGLVEPTRRKLASGVGLFISQHSPTSIWTWLWIISMTWLFVSWTARLFASGDTSRPASPLPPASPIATSSDAPLLTPNSGATSDSNEQDPTRKT